MGDRGLVVLQGSGEMVLLGYFRVSAMAWVGEYLGRSDPLSKEFSYHGMNFSIGLYSFDRVYLPSSKSPHSPSLSLAYASEVSVRVLPPRQRAHPRFAPSSSSKHRATSNKTNSRLHDLYFSKQQSQATAALLRRWIRSSSTSHKSRKNTMSLASGCR